MISYEYFAFTFSKVQHARMSFEIASMFAGHRIAPDAFPADAITKLRPQVSNDQRNTIHNS